MYLVNNTLKKVVFTLKNCSVCKENTDLGINILQSFICNKCLDRISKTQVDDPEYENILLGIKRVWQLNEVVSNS